MLKVFGFLLAILACSSKVATGFSPLPHRARAATFLAVKFDKKLNKWITTKNDEGPEAGYDIWGTLLRGGPKPFLARIFGPDQYEQAVLKFMAGDKVGRMEAQANMDIYMQNPNDWLYDRMTGANKDYVTLKKQDIVLRIAWVIILFTYLGFLTYHLQTGDTVNLSGTSFFNK